MVVALEGPRRERIACLYLRILEFPVACWLPLFVNNVVHWLAGRRSERRPLKAGQTFIPAKNEQISQSPSAGRGQKGQTQPLSGGAPIRLTKNGFYQVAVFSKPDGWRSIRGMRPNQTFAARGRTIFPSWQRAGEPCRSGWLAALSLIVLEWFFTIAASRNKDDLAAGVGP